MRSKASNALDLVEPAEISFGPQHRGGLRMIAIDAGLDYRITKEAGQPRGDFSWSGFDEGDPISGRGCAKRDGDRLVGKPLIHDGDESMFVATRIGS